jgi:hypothetical protein
VRYSVEGELRDVYHCYCGRCRRFTGHHMAATAAPPSHVSFDANETLTWYSPDPAVEYGFRNRCGSSLFWRAAAIPDKLCICAGTLDQPTGLTTTKAWWVAESPDYHPRSTGVEEFDRED